MSYITLQECIRRLDGWSAPFNHVGERKGVGHITQALVKGDGQEGLDAFSEMRADCQRVSRTLKSLLNLQEDIDDIQGKNEGINH